MGADDGRAVLDREPRGGKRAAETLRRLGWHDGMDETLARGTDQERQAEAAPGVEPGDAGQALLRRLAEADAGVEHDALAGNAGPGGDVERAVEEGGDVGDDIDGRIGGVAIVHDN